MKTVIDTERERRRLRKDFLFQTENRVANQQIMFAVLPFSTTREFPLIFENNRFV